MLGPSLFVYKGFSVIFFVLQKKMYNRNLKNVVKEKRCTRDILVGAEKISHGKIKIEDVSFRSKK